MTPEDSENVPVTYLQPKPRQLLDIIRFAFDFFRTRDA